ncbi:hypothetical protein LPJ66_010622, partial [Kickxella alabastrina]
QQQKQQPPTPLRILFFGTNDFGKGILSHLHESQRRGAQNTQETQLIRELLVVCPPSAIAQNPQSTFKKKHQQPTVIWESPVDAYAREFELPTEHVQSRNLNRWVLPYTGGRFDLAVVAGYDAGIPPALAGQFPRGVLSVHASLLPKYRGAEPVAAAVMAGDSVTGVTVCEYDCAQMDGGQVLAQIPLPLSPTVTRSDILRDLGHLGGQLLVKCLENLDFVRAHSVEQDHKRASWAPVYAREEARVRWERMGAEEIVRRYRAFHGLWTMHTVLRKKSKMRELFLHKLYLPEEPPVKLPVGSPSPINLLEPLDPKWASYPPGSMFYRRKVPYLEVPCVDGRRLHVRMLKVKGRTMMTALQFVNGYLRKPGAVRMLSEPVRARMLTPAFVYPAGHPNYVDPEDRDRRRREWLNHRRAKACDAHEDAENDAEEDGDEGAGEGEDEDEDEEMGHADAHFDVLEEIDEDTIDSVSGNEPVDRPQPATRK